MVSMYDVQGWLKSKNPAWTFTKVLFVSWLLMKIIDKYTKQNVTNTNQYQKVLQKGNSIIWFDPTSSTYAVEQPNGISLFNDLNNAKKQV